MCEEFNITDNKQLCDVETYYNRSQLYVVGRFLCNMSHTLYSKKKKQKKTSSPWICLNTLRSWRSLWCLGSNIYGIVARKWGCSLWEDQRICGFSTLIHRHKTSQQQFVIRDELKYLYLLSYVPDLAEQVPINQTTCAARTTTHKTTPGDTIMDDTCCG